MIRAEQTAKSERLLARLTNCDLCPRRCQVDRTRSADGICRTSANLKVAAYNLHFGEEPPISGSRGSGTIFLAGCNLECVYCQNYDISQYNQGVEVTEKQFVEIMLRLQEAGAHNINFVTPTHFSAQIHYCLSQARSEGFKLPIVYNSSGYDAVDVLREFEGMIDVYMPDMRYSDAQEAECYSGAADYPEVNRDAIKEMHRQVGDLVLDNSGVAVRGLLVRHLVLPDRIAGTAEILRFLAKEVSTSTYLSLMSQYRPAYKAGENARIDRRITRDEYLEAKSLAEEFGMSNCYLQGMPN
jgi:putative pyruvate formate lyase activating enzyme